MLIDMWLNVRPFPFIWSCSLPSAYWNILSHVACNIIQSNHYTSVLGVVCLEQLENIMKHMYLHGEGDSNWQHPQCIVTCRPTARQRLGKHIPATNLHSTIEGYSLLVNGAVNMAFSVRSVPRSYKGTGKTRRSSRQSTAEYALVVESSRMESRNWQLQKRQESD
jgi:hypothetical protein